MGEHSREVRIWGTVVAVAAVGVLVAFLVPSAALGAASAVLAALALWNLVRLGDSGAPLREEAASSAAVPGPSPSRLTAADVRERVRIPPTLDPPVVLAAFADAVSAIAPPLAAHLWLEDEASATLRLIAAHGAVPPMGQPLPLDASDPVSIAVRENRAVLERLGPVGQRVSAGVWRLALPLEAGQARGVAAVDVRAEGPLAPDALPDASAPLRGSLTGCLALHVARMELESARTLIEVARDLSRILDPDEVLSTALDRAMAASDAETGSVMLLDEATGRLVIVVSRGLPPEVAQNTSVAEGEGIAGWVLATRQPLLIEDLPARTPAGRRHGVRSAVCVPIADDHGVFGVMNVGSRRFPARFTQSHLDAIETLGRQTATALRNARAIAETREVCFETLRTLAMALEANDPYARGGAERVLECATALGEAFDLTDEEREALRLAALLHDIGMPIAGEGVLTTDRPLTTVERALLTMHPRVAAEMLAQAPALRHVVPIVYHHHEWYDGSGYVSGLKGESIPLGARILAVADAYVAMTSERPYRPALTQEQALQNLIERAGTQFDPDVVEALRQMLHESPDKALAWSGRRD